MKGIFFLAFSLMSLGFTLAAQDTSCEMEKRQLQVKLNRVNVELQRVMKDVVYVGQQEEKDIARLSVEITSALHLAQVIANYDEIIQDARPFYLLPIYDFY
ncbi:hypothetical protein INT43_004737 [Umbelopsis isabellina]|uniref:Uncharacterized protein n=1 Tax=Mortierella isabellina TaxID=91625 RepID=A0A8H7UB18_MORIS|nr:hypothetical protein INT43_004737 [Umbelopsis isabellina]